MDDIKRKDKVTINKEQEKKTELQFVRRVVPHNGHILYEINDETKEIFPAQYLDGLDWHFILGNDWKSKAAKITSTVIVKSGHSYVSALNKSNAMKLYLSNRSGGKNTNSIMSLSNLT